MAYNDKPMRRSSLISPWGVGAIVPFPGDESLMIAGLDMWHYKNSNNFVIKDERLQKRLGVQELRWPPDYRENNADKSNSKLTIPAVRFPSWHYCPFCGRMEKATLYQNQPTCDAYPWKSGRKCDSKHRRKMIPERFIVICPEGHIDDFPVAEWLHYGTGHVYNPDTCKIRRSTGGASASLSGVYYECTCGAKKSMSLSALSDMNYTCQGYKPWLGDEHEQCGNNNLKVVLRGATNVWFADTRSSIYIPTDDDQKSAVIHGIVEDYYDFINIVDGKLNKDVIGMFARKFNVDPDELYKAFERKLNGLNAVLDVNENMSEDEYRLAEYNVLIKNSGSDAQEFHSVNYPINTYNPIISKYFKSISLVHKLQETRAFVGFSRVAPKNVAISESKKMLRKGSASWLPAIRVNGEGIFFEFNKEELQKWAQRPDVASRIRGLSASYNKSNFSSRSPGELKPEFIAIHTFAHILINQLSFECGYGSSSIRERIYCEKTSNEHDMYGVLIYTASGDSEGSLGGLVRQGEKNRIEDTIISAVRNAAWCSSDPVCIQSLGQGPESCNLAACHNCAILPETCCENGNRLLDRGVIVGTLDNPGIGFFRELCE